MNKKAFSIVLSLIILATPILALDECDRFSTPDEVPCMITNGYKPDEACGTHRATVFTNNGSAIYSEDLRVIGDTGFCEFTFNESTVGTYYANMTTGDTATVVVEDGNLTELLIYFALALGLGLLIIGVWKDDDTIRALSAITFLLSGVWILVNGFDILTNILTTALGSVLIGFGAYIFIGTYISRLQQEKG